jgi:uncharacterized protein (DUF608 family)
MTNRFKANRRDFLKQAAGALGAATQVSQWPAIAERERALDREKEVAVQQEQDYPRRFEGRQLRMIAFPLGGVAAGSISLGGRGQLRDWEIFNRPNKGFRPRYAFPSVWAQAGDKPPVVRVLESRIQPPYEGPDGLGADNVPGLSRLESATFIGSYPMAHIDFHDPALPVKVELDAFSPFIPHDPEDSGLPVAVLHYRITNPGTVAATVGIAFSVENPVFATGGGPTSDRRLNEFRSEGAAAGLLMSNAGLPSDHPMSGSFALAALPAGADVSHWAGWPQGKWWNAPLLFWDQFSRYGRLEEQPEPHNAVGALCLQRIIAPGQSADFRFLLGWHFPNRTPAWCGWEAPPGEENTVIGNYYATRFRHAWQAVTYAAQHLDSLEARTQVFAAALRDSTLPGVVKEAASANLSTLATTTCFRTADGEFHGFEGSRDALGCCFGNCTHVWNYETVTPFLFPTFARSLRKSAFGYSMDEIGAMHFRQLLPDGNARSANAAADGQMGQIVHAWLDWKLSGDQEWLRAIWPRVKKAIEFAWIPGGWDSNRDGVLEGVQHNTYDVEFYGPNPMCGIYYLAALKAGAEMADAAGDSSAALEYRKLLEEGSRWIDAHLFNGEYYVQEIRGFSADKIAPSLRGGMGAEDTEKPEFQVGAGCLIDQLVGQYLADVGNLGAVVDPQHVRKALGSIYRYNARRTLAEHENVARTYALNDEAAVVICDYATAKRPHIPFPYYSEVWSGLEYVLAALMISWGMVQEGIECVRNTRRRYDGEKRNPWDEAECGHHYARAMSSWSVLVALSGFSYDGCAGAVTAVPRAEYQQFKSFWATATAWGTFAYAKSASNTQFTLSVLAGTLDCRSCEIAALGSSAAARIGKVALASSVKRQGDRLAIHLLEPLSLPANAELRIEVQA